MKTKFKYLITTIILLFLLTCVGSCVMFVSNSAGFQRAKKDWSSNYRGGIHRVVTVYSYTGEEISSWEGKFDISQQDDEVKFDMDNGKRVIVRGGIVISEEVVDGEENSE